MPMRLKYSAHMTVKARLEASRTEGAAQVDIIPCWKRELSQSAHLQGFCARRSQVQRISAFVSSYGEFYSLSPVLKVTINHHKHP